MQDSKIANYILYDLAKKINVPRGFGVNGNLISDVVEGWDQRIYIVPNQSLKLHHHEPKKYQLM